MAQLGIHLLGQLQITLDGKPVAGFESNKVRALLAYLALESDCPHSRDALIGLLWDNQPDRAARRNLSQALFNLRQAIHDDDRSLFLCVTRETVQFNRESDHWLDTSAFAAHLTAIETHPHTHIESCQTCIRHLEEADAQYRGEFLAGFFVDSSVPFSEWVTLRRERFHHQVLDAQFHLANHYEQGRDFVRASHYARRQVELEPWREEAHQQLMRLLIRAGQRSAALQQFETCRRILANELQIEPSEETHRLYRRIKSVSEIGAHNLPPQATPFVGRETELREITKRLLNPHCRLLTLIGSGGIGKTRLAIQSACENRVLFLNGVFFIPLAAAGSAEFLVSTVANGLGLQFQGARDPTMQLLDYLQEKELLLVMDEFEHLLQESDLLTRILQRAPLVKILVTSRERLNLHAECILDVQGLSYPHDERKDQASHYDAVQLFLQNASRVRGEFVLSESTLPHVVHICRLVEGMPLGVELASAWVRAFSCERIANEIQHDLGFLTSSLRDVPEHHRSLRAIFEHSCKLLSDRERDALYRLSIFQGGFEKDAAEQVAKASWPILVALAGKSLLHQNPAGRYNLHGLLRQYAMEKLYEIPGALEKTRDLHGTCYADFLHQREDRLKGRELKHTLEEIGLEIDNVRAGWRWAVEHGDTENIAKYLNALYIFYCVRGWFYEGKEVFAHAEATLQANPVPAGDAPRDQQTAILSRIQARHGRFAFHLGDYGKAKELYQTSLETSRRLGDRENVAFALVNLGFVSHVQGEFEQAKQFSQESIGIYRDLGDPSGIALGLNNLGNVARAAGDYAEAQQLYQECLALRRQIGDAFGAAVALNNLGNIAEALGEYPKAEKLYQENHALCQEIGYTQGVAASLTNLGCVAWKLGAHPEAKRLHEKSLELKGELGDRRSMIVSLINLGEVTGSLGEDAECVKYFGQALKMAAAIQAAPLIIAALTGTATFFVKTENKEIALALCVYISQHSASKQEFRDRAASLQAELITQLPQDLAATTRTRAMTWTLDDALTETQALLASYGTLTATSDFNLAQR